MIQPYNEDIYEKTLKNNKFRKIIYTNKFQVVLMNIEPKHSIHLEKHKVDQLFFIVKGSGCAVINDITHKFKKHHVLIVPANITHEIINTSSKNQLKLYTIYSSPQH